MFDRISLLRHCLQDDRECSVPNCLRYLTNDRAQNCVLLSVITISEVPCWGKTFCENGSHTDLFDLLGKG